MKYFILSLLVLFTLNTCRAFGKTEAQCVKQMSIDTKTSQEKILSILVTCIRVKSKGLQNIINDINYHTQLNAVEVLNQYEACTIMSKHFRAYMKGCKDVKNSSNKKKS